MCSLQKKNVISINVLHTELKLGPHEFGQTKHFPFFGSVHYDNEF